MFTLVRLAGRAPAGKSVDPAALYDQDTGWRSTDSLGRLQTSRLLRAGTANYKALDGGGRNRWGDYAGVAADPGNPRLVRLYSMLAQPDNEWGTWTGLAAF